ncbi:MAG: hypothetical protein QOH72_1484 [Solirubrobacteraceae bacterium]|nr:hypothetical protein [Solirubrobacteraceae bacterium]
MPSAHSALAAALAWLIARRLLGHSDPFFAPVAAAIALSTIPVRRIHRIVQMVLGVLLGIAVGSVTGAVLGVSTPALAAAVLATMLAARAFGAGFVGDGVMLVNQAAGSAIIVLVLHHGGTGAERAVDALVGGAVALLVGVVLFPARPLPLLRAAERAVLGSTASALEAVGRLLSAGTPAEPAWTDAAAHEIQAQLTELTAARSAAQLNVSVAPRRWAQRAMVDDEDRRLARLHPLAAAVVALLRAATAALEDGRPVPASLDRHIAALATAMRRLAATPHPRPPGLLDAVEEVAAGAIAAEREDSADWPPDVAAGVRITARELREIAAQARGTSQDRPFGHPAQTSRDESIWSRAGVAALHRRLLRRRVTPPAGDVAGR